MKYSMIAVMSAVAVLLGASAARSETIQIQLSGLDIAYNGTNIYDSDPAAANPDPLVTVAILKNGILAGPVLQSDIALDMFFPNVLNIPKTGGEVQSGSGGDFHLYLPSGDKVDLTLGKASVVYVSALGLFHFAFAASAANIDSVSLPYGVTLAEPVSVSFSSQINPTTLTDNGTYLNSFRASGTGEIAGVPEPSTLVLLGVGAFGLLAFTFVGTVKPHLSRPLA